MPLRHTNILEPSLNLSYIRISVTNQIMNGILSFSQKFSALIKVNVYNIKIEGDSSLNLGQHTKEVLPTLFSSPLRP